MIATGEMPSEGRMAGQDDTGEKTEQAHLLYNTVSRGVSCILNHEVTAFRLF